ncbi:cytidyltransferase [Neobacillus sp. OS1-32]|uniref:cytidyltransferase n=1 Tax=Neobacillus sp. OS1-32 TaxID=3070682 RepID=UPI0027E03E70|nr:cytidyltransferase [Neobacillus sp. OS1-32]WML31772.1 cytidyltransferase [Neobacillus sp. OS1-32]
MEIIHIQHPISETLKNQMAPCALALGFFDGVHKAHQKLLQTTKEIAERNQIIFAVMTFFPHPREIINPKLKMRYLTPMVSKEERFLEMGVEKLFVVQFDPYFSSLSPEEFVEHYIIGVKCRHVVAGFDYHYGRMGKGDIEMLTNYGKGNFSVTMVSKLEYEGKKISSTAIRELLSLGNVQTIPHFLGDYYVVSGQVQQSSIYYKNHQFLKILIDQYRSPSPSVYKVIVELEGKRYWGICHQISLINNYVSLLVHVSNCFINAHQKRVKVIWLEKIFGKQKEVFDMGKYLDYDELII